MSNSKIYLAVAGAGKTYQICHNLDKEKRNLILSYTNENIINIKKELIDQFNEIPSKTIVQTYDSFLLEYFIWPYFKMIQEELFQKPFRQEKCLSFNKTIVDPNKLWQNTSTNFSKYFIKSTKGNYILKNDQISTLILTDSLKFSNGKSLLDIGIARINKFYDCLYIDEFQDYRKDKYKLMVKIMQNVSNGIMYGDYYQHSVAGEQNSGAPFLKSTTYKKFVNEMKKNGFDVDDNSLLKTRRCSEKVCKFIREKFNINIYSDVDMNRMGNITYVMTKEQINTVISKNKIKILSLNNESKWHSVSFGLSKGNTYENTLVVLPDKYLKDKTSGILSIDDGVIKNKIYVALTRATGETYITSRKVMQEYFK
jgi:hypothetical protein